MEQAIGDPAPLPDAHADVLRQWAELVRSEKIRSQNEVSLHGDFKTQIVEKVLGYRPFGSEQGQTVAAEHPMGGGPVDLALGWFDEPDDRVLAPFELKGAATRDLDAPMPGRKKTPVEQAWGYAIAKPGVRWVLVSNYCEIRLYSYGEGVGAYETFDLSRVDDPRHYAKLMLLLSAENLLGGRTAELLERSREADKEISQQLYADYRRLREGLIAIIRKLEPEGDAVEAVAVGQKILDRVLFIAFAEDTGLLPHRSLARAFEHRDPYNPLPVWENFKGLFRAIDEGNQELHIPRYNGGLFEPDERIDRLALPDPVCEGFRQLGAYHFGSEVSVTILGRIFEQSIADIERLLARARGEVEELQKKTGAIGRRKRDGIVYTPDYIARFIAERTLGAHLGELFAQTMREHALKGDAADYESLRFSTGRRDSKEEKQAAYRAWADYRFRLKSLRIVDPACGSGVFLVMAFDFLKAEYDRVNKKLMELQGGVAAQSDLEDIDREILSQNLYGVDVNPESIEITKLSLWLKTARRDKVLDSLGHTIRVGDSLIEDSNFAYLQHGFNWKTAFPEVFAAGGFDVVLGNPPYVRMELIKPLKPYLEKRFEVVSDRADLYCYFYERGLRLLKPGGRLGYISSSTFFKTGSGAPLRRFLLNNATLETVINFGDLQVFEGVTTYPAIITMRAGNATDRHELRFWNPEAIPAENFSATFDEHAEPYPQTELPKERWHFEGPELRIIRKKICESRLTLKKVYGSPLRGIVTGLNEAFIIDRATRDRLIAEDPKSAELLKPFLEGEDLKRWCVEPRDLWIIYIPKGTVDIDRYPAIKAHLLPFRDRLERRATRQEWFELQQAQAAYVPAFEGPKLVYVDMASECAFSLDSDGRYLANTSYFVPNADAFLLAYANSNIAWFFWVGVSAILRGGFIRLFVQNVEQTPIPDAHGRNREAIEQLAMAAANLSRQRLIRQRQIARRIPDLCPPDSEAKMTTKLQDWWTLPDFAAFRAEVKKAFKADIPLSDRNDWEDLFNREKVEIERLNAEIARNEAEINRIVYALFDLTDDEIALLEDSIGVGGDHRNLSLDTVTEQA